MDLGQLIEALGSPEAYPHPVDRIHVVQTHASCVFLTGPYAYKIKKPVDFGFLDYSTLELRRRYCREELRLNRRFCPEVYLDVAPITAAGAALRMAGEGPPVEWALRMRQLPEEDLLSSRLAAGRVDRADMERVARRIARIHWEAPSSREIRKAGSIETITRNVEENFDQTADRVGWELPAEHFTAIRQFAERMLRDGGYLFVRRVREGWIRDGHGDLRAQNICLYPGLSDGIQILDCIEFAERFRWGDVAADLAYLAMDLDLAGRADLRRTLVEHYQEATGDAGLPDILPFYLCYRAYVRGKIALLAGGEPEIPEEQRQEHLRTAAAAFDLARSYTERPAVARLILMSGYSGSGKSVLARELARRLGAVRLSTDEVRKEPAADAPDYSREGRRRIYTHLYERAEELLTPGETVILDATFLDAEERERAVAAARRSKAQRWLLACHCAEEVIRQRLADRSRQGTDTSDADLAVYEAQLQNHPVMSDEAFAGRFVTIDTGSPIAETVREALKSLWRRADSARNPRVRLAR